MVISHEVDARRVAEDRRGGGQHPRRLRRAHDPPGAGRRADREAVHPHCGDFYVELRRCRGRCSSAPHVCRPMAASTVRQVHAVVSGALSDPDRHRRYPTRPRRRMRHGSSTGRSRWTMTGALRPTTLKDEEPVMRQRLGQFGWCEAASHGFL